MSEFTTTELIERLKKLLGVKSDGEVADRLSISRAALSMKKVRNSPILNEVMHLAREQCIDLNWLLLGAEPVHVIRGGVEDAVLLRDEKGREVSELKPSSKYLQSRNLDPGSLVVVRHENGDLSLVDTRVNKITTAGIYAISTGDSVLLRRATMRLDGSILFPSKTPDIPPEQIDRSAAEKLLVLGRVALVFAAAD
ncbi:MAG: hypothetical protein EG828_16125 [Deltaproteobacteria bacterium]|nr:hypothetical protein [Deltaproteobacteria bacterium]